MCNERLEIEIIIVICYTSIWTYRGIPYFIYHLLHFTFFVFNTYVYFSKKICQAIYVSPKRFVGQL